MKTLQLIKTTLAFGSMLALGGIAHAQSFSMDTATAYCRAQDWNGLFEYASAATQTDPKSDEAWSSVGCAEMHLGRDAVDAYKHAIQLNPNKPAFWNNLTAAYVIQGDIDAAVVTTDRETPLLKRMNDPNAWYAQGNAYQHLRQPAWAVTSYLNALRIAPNFGACWTNLGASLDALGDLKGATDAAARGQALGDPLASVNMRMDQQEAASVVDQRNEITRIAQEMNTYERYAAGR